MEQVQNNFANEITLRDYARMVFRHWPIFVTAVAVVSSTVFVGLKMRTPVYEAHVKMLISSEKETQAPYSRDLLGYDKSQLNLTQSEIVKSAPVLERAVKASKLDQRPWDYEKQFASGLRIAVLERMAESDRKFLQQLQPAQRDYVLFRRAVDNLRENITITPIRDTSLFTISVTDYDPFTAAALANIVSRSYVIFDLEQQLAEMTTKYGDRHPMVSLLKDHISRMTDNLNGSQLENIDAIGPATVKIIDQAAIPMKSEGRSKVLILALAIILGIFLGLILCFIFEYLDQSVRSPRDLSAVLDLPIMGKIPYQIGAQEILTKEKRNAAKSYMIAYHELACQIRFFVNQKKMKVFLFTAPDVDEGTTTVVSNLGKCLAKDFKKTTLIIDAHYHAANLHTNFKNSISPGLVEVLSGHVALSQAVREIEPNLWLLSAGNKEVDPESLLDSPKMAEILNEAKESFDVVLIDCADLRNYRDSISLGNFVDGFVIVVSEGKTRRPAIAAATAPLKENQFNLIGTVLNRRTFALPKWIYERV